MGPQRERGGVLKVLAGAALLVAVVGVAAVVVWHRGGFREDGPIGSLFSPGTSHRAEELRQRFRFESLADRLDYEGDDPSGEEVPLPEAAAGRLDEVEKGFDLWIKASPRMMSLARLHSDQVEEFVNQPDFGNFRTFHMDSPAYLDLPQAPPVPFAQVLALPSGGEGSRIELPETAVAPALSLKGLDEFHDRGRFDFLNPGNFTDSSRIGTTSPASVRTASGRCRSCDPLHMAMTSEERWAVGRLELVSLLKHERPAVYISDHLPRMDDLKKSKTRPPSEFEARSVEDPSHGRRPGSGGDDEPHPADGIAAGDEAVPGLPSRPSRRPAGGVFLRAAARPDGDLDLAPLVENDAASWIDTQFDHHLPGRSRSR